MEYLIKTTIYFIHLLATVIWIGGIFLILYNVIPSAKEYMGKEASKFMAIISKGFTPFANYSILTLVVTGILMIIFYKGIGSLLFETLYSRILLIKLLIAATMFIIHFYRGLVLNPKIARLSSVTGESSKDVREVIIPKLQRLSLNLVKTNFVLGVAVLLLSSALITT